jgi:spermidine/putrescine transport system ATP-binding protein
MVTHDQNEAMIMSDRIMVMHAGRIEQVGSPTELYDYPATAYVAEFLGTSNMLTATVARDGSRAVVRAGDLAIELPDLAGGIADGATRTLFIRPEKIRLVNGAPPEGASTFQGKVLEMFFSGNAVRIDLDVGANRPLMVHHQLDTGLSEAGLPAVGDTVTCAVRPEIVGLFDSAEVAAVEAEGAAA